MENRLMIGLEETIVLENGKRYKAKIDTGADSSSIDKELAKSLGNKEIVSHKFVRSALGRHKRPMVNLKVQFQGIEFNENFSISDRSNLRFKILIGKDILQKERFLIDTLKGLNDKQNKKLDKFIE